jgi:hypothetical protein
LYGVSCHQEHRSLVRWFRRERRPLLSARFFVADVSSS